MDFYHIYNRGVEKRDIFSDETDLQRFNYSIHVFNTKEPIGSIYHSNLKKNLGVGHLKNEPLVNIAVYCLNPNHFHLLVGSETPENLSEYIKRLGGGYTNYFNQRHKRSGSLFQGKTKKVQILNNAQLNYVASYILGNREVHGLDKEEILTMTSFDKNHKDEFSFNTYAFYKESCKLGKMIREKRRDLEGLEVEVSDT